MPDRPVVPLSQGLWQRPPAPPPPDWVALAARLRDVPEAERYEAARRYMQRYYDRPPPVPDFTAGLAGLYRSFAEAGNTLLRAFGGMMTSLTRAGHQRDARLHPRAHVRCRICHPCANSGPLCIDGRAYQRRQQNRKRRRGH